MKRSFTLLTLAAVALFTASCSKSADMSQAAEVAFNIEKGDLLTKTISDGKQADQLYYVVFKCDAAGTKTAIEGTVNSVSFPYSSLKVNLAKGFSYKLLFFAQNTELQAYTVTTADGYSAIMEADYSKLTTGSEAGDAFFAYKDITVTGPMTETVTLRRAVAQVNVGCNDFADFGATAASDLASVGVSFTDLPTKVQLFDGSVLETSGSVTPVVFADAASPMTDPDTITVGENEYKYVSMNYVLAPSPEPTLIGAAFSFTALDSSPVASISVSNVPVRMNHRTNIIGQLLTGSAVFNIVIDEQFDEPDYDVIY